MTILEQIENIRKDKSVLWKYGKSKKQVLAEILAAVDGMIAARCYLPNNFKINEIIGLPESWTTKTGGTISMSYRQMRNYVANFIKTGRHLKRPYKITGD